MPAEHQERAEPGETTGTGRELVPGMQAAIGRQRVVGVTDSSVTMLVGVV